ncbi:GTPase [Thermopirellula anaerolimosa]
MSIFDHIWKKSVSSPRELDEAEQTVSKLRDRLPVLTFRLVGKTQAGKTSIIHALTGRSREEIGDGFRPCTKTTRVYRFPSEEQFFVQFVDAPGLGDAEEATASDALLEEESNRHHQDCLMVVMKAMDPGQDAVRRAAAEWQLRRADRPMVIVQTCLHEGYPWREPKHILPYPFSGDNFAATVPGDLARALRLQRSWFSGPNVWFAAVDFTLPEDGYEPVLYGLDVLWEAIEQAVPWGLREAIRGTPELYEGFADALFRKAHPFVVWYALTAGTAAAVPWPFADLPAVIGIPLLMTKKLAAIYEQPWSSERVLEIMGALGFRFATRYLAKQLTRWIPFVGSIASAGFVAGSTYALGVAMCRYYGDLRRGAVPNPEVLRELYQEELKQSREWLSLRLKQGFARDDVGRQGAL